MLTGFISHETYLNLPRRGGDGMYADARPGTGSRSRGATCPSLTWEPPFSQVRAQGRPGACRHPQPRVQGHAHGWVTGEADTSAFPARMVLTVSFALSPGRRALLPPSPGRYRAFAPVDAKRIRQAWRQTSGARTTRLLRTRTSPLDSPQLTCAHRKDHMKTLSAPCRCARHCRSRKHFRPATLPAPTPSRPPHPGPRLATIAIRPC